MSKPNQPAPSAAAHTVTAAPPAAPPAAPTYDTKDIVSIIQELKGSIIAIQKSIQTIEGTLSTSSLREVQTETMRGEINTLQTELLQLEQEIFSIVSGSPVNGQSAVLESEVKRLDETHPIKGAAPAAPGAGDPAAGKKP